MGLGTYFGNLVSQNGKGHLLGHVKDLGEDSSKIDEVRIYRTNARYVYIFTYSFFLKNLNLIYPEGGVFFFLKSLVLDANTGKNIAYFFLLFSFFPFYIQTTQTGK